MPFLRGTRYAVAAAGGGAVAAPSPLLTDLFAYYTLDEASGTAVDALGSRNLTAFNSPVSTTGTIDNARAFVAASSQRLTSAATDFPGGADMSASLWFNTADASTNYPLLSLGDNYTVGISAIHNASSGVKTVQVLRGGLTNSLVSSGGYAISTWHHAVVTWQASDGEFKLYVNGSLVSTVTNTVSLGNTSLWVGYGTFAYHNGAIDEVGFWSRALSADEVSLLYNSGSGRTYPFA